MNFLLSLSTILDGTSNYGRNDLIDYFTDFLSWFWSIIKLGGLVLVVLMEKCLPPDTTIRPVKCRKDALGRLRLILAHCNVVVPEDCGAIMMGTIVLLV